jgi:hypothetical protein
MDVLGREAEAHASVFRSSRRPATALFGNALDLLYPYQHKWFMKPLQFLGDSLQCLRNFPMDARQDAGYQLDKVQRGLQPDDFKPMPTIGSGVEEIRIRDDSGIYRVFIPPGLPTP